MPGSPAGARHRDDPVAGSETRAPRSDPLGAQWLRTGCGPLLPPPARCGRGPGPTPQSTGSAPRRHPPARPYRGGGHGGTVGAGLPPKGGTGGREGRGKRGPCGARNSLPGAARLPVTTTTALKPRAPGVRSRAPRLRRRRGSRASSSGQAGRPGSAATTRGHQRSLTPALPAA